MAELTANFDLGTNGQEITTSDPGDASPWDVVNKNDSISYDESPAIGVNSAHFLTTGGGGTAHLRWESSFGTQTEYYGRVCVYREAFPAIAYLAANVYQRTGGTGTSWQWGITSTGKIEVYNQAAGLIATSTATIPLDAWWRVEYYANHSTDTLEVRYYTDAMSETLTETVCSGGSKSIAADAESFDIGIQALTESTWMDAVVTKATDWPGPPLALAGPRRFAGPLRLGTSPTTLLTSTGRSLIEMIHLSNPSGSPVDFTLSIGDDAAGTRIYDGYSIPADTERKLRQLFVLENGETVQAFAGTDAVLDISVDGRVL
jgi:hypothetical protein